MKALVLEDRGKLRVQHDRPVPPAPGERPVLLRVAACGVCGSDVPRAYHGKAYFYPLVMGHEFCGFVQEPPPGSEFSAGDRVVVFPLMPSDPTDPAYQTGDYAQCKKYNYFGSRCDGGFEEFVRVPEWNLLPVPDHVETLHAALVEPAAVALHAVRKMRIKAGDTAVVYGNGFIGNLAAQWLRIHGCQRVIVVDVDEHKLEIARRMGLTTINASEIDDPVRRIMELTDGRGAPLVLEACGLPLTFLQSIRSAARFADVVFAGNIQGEFSIGEKDFSSILRKEIRIHGTWNSKIVPQGRDDWTSVLNFLDQGLNVAPLISDIPSLDEGPDVFDSLLNGDKFHYKVVFDIGAESS